MRRKEFLIILTGLAALAAVLFLRPGFIDLAGPSRNAVLQAIGADVALPAYQRFHTLADVLKQTASDFCAAPDGPRRQEAQAAWRAARTAWKTAETYNAGPAKTLRLDTRIDFWPLRPWIVDTELAKTTPVNDQYVQTLGNAARGLPVVEYLLFGAPTDGEPSRLTGSRTCALLMALTRDLQASAQELIEAWQPFAKSLATAGKGSADFPTSQDAVNLLVNQLVAVSYAIEDMKLGRPLGKRHGNLVQPDAFESYVSGHSLADIQANLVGMRSLYMGVDGPHGGYGLKDLVPKKLRDLDTRVIAAIDQLSQDLQAIQPTLAAAATAGNPATDAALKSAIALNHVLSADLISALGVTPTFSDNDGD